MSGLDPRPAVIERRFRDVRRVVAVGGGKGGIGKSFVAAGLALSLARLGRRAGLFDLDLTGPSAHVVLGIEPRFPSETHGVDPFEAHGVHFLSVACFAGRRAVPLRGEATRGALLELLAITNWGKLDVLVVDMPPGLNDTLLEIARLLPRAEHLVVATPSRVVLETVRKHLGLLRRLGNEALGIVENLAREPNDAVRILAATTDTPYLGCIPWDDNLENATGHPDRLLETRAMHAVQEIAEGQVSVER